MTNPCLVEVTRGPLVESRHYGAIVVCDASGRTVLSLGDVERPVFPRSAVKALQAVPLVESGAADALGLSDAELALACASHNGEPGHVETAAAMLARTGRDASALECGAHWPRRVEDQRALHLAGELPTAIYNNCSGKHSGFVCLAHHLGVDPKGYVGAGHVVQQTVRACMEDFTGAAHDADCCGIDGCSIPTYAVPLSALARALAAFGSGEGLVPDRRRAAERLLRACAAHPFHVAGSERFCTEVMTRFGERVFVKTGAEGVFCAAFPERGLGVALKCDDGAVRAAEVMMASVIAAFVPCEGDEAALLERLATASIVNWNGIRVGTVAASRDFVHRLEVNR